MNSRTELTSQETGIDRSLAYPDQRNRLLISTFQLVASGLLAFLIAFATVAWRNDQSPDIFTDEILYTRLGYRVASEGALVWDTGSTNEIHPPVYFLLEAGYLWLTGRPLETPVITRNAIFSTVHQARYLNAMLAGVTAVVLLFIGRGIYNMKLGWLLLVLFSIDPFGVRTNRRAMLETLSGLLGLGGIALLLIISKDQLQRIQRLVIAISAGLLMGLALLTKEMVFSIPLSVLIFGIWEAWRNAKDKLRKYHIAWSAPLLAGSLAFTTYLILPIWALINGDWDKFVRVKSLAFRRLLGLVHTSGWNRSGVSVWDFIGERLLNYWTSYLLFALGGITLLVLLFTRKKSYHGRLMVIWGFVIYPLMGFVTFFGPGNDQFFYYLLLPSTILVGYLVTMIMRAGQNGAVHKAGGSGRQSISSDKRLLHGVLKAILILVMLAILTFNLVSWIKQYGVNSDNGYFQLAEYISANIEPGTPINASGDPLKSRYFFAEYPVSDASTPQEAEESGIQYFVIAPKDLRSHFGPITPELAAWVVQNGQLLFFVNSYSYGDIYLYKVLSPATTAAEVQSGYQFKIQPPKTGFVQPFVIMLAIWIPLWEVGVPVFMARKKWKKRLFAGLQRIHEKRG